MALSPQMYVKLLSALTAKQFTDMAPRSTNLAIILYETAQNHADSTMNCAGTDTTQIHDASI